MSSAPGALDFLRGLAVDPAAADSEVAFLQPDEAFVLSVDVLDPGSVIVRWTLAESYYLYRKSFAFKSAAAMGITVGAPIFPLAESKADPYFGAVEVYYDEVQVVLPIERRAHAPSELSLEIQYQGCTDKGLCYPPITTTISVALPAR